jgi:hypothetical protein
LPSKNEMPASEAYSSAEEFLELACLGSNLGGLTGSYKIYFGGFYKCACSMALSMISTSN